MNRYFRLQPAGLGLSGHRSLTSNDETPYGIDVFLYAHNVIGSDTWAARDVNDEILVLESEEEGWDNEDAEGWRLDPETATIVARVPVTEWPEYVDGLGGGGAVVSAYAAVGTDGLRDVVWGLGDTPEAALEDAARWLAEERPVRTAEALDLHEVSEERAAAVRAGDVVWDGALPARERQ